MKSRSLKQEDQADDKSRKFEQKMLFVIISFERFGLLAYPYLSPDWTLVDYLLAYPYFAFPYLNENAIM